ncbi:hypothetical protein [Imhoffiella purpurea]|nr:hypothetical protein [Imhoffiella purpurea]
MPRIEDADMTLDWFEAGEAIFEAATDDPSCYPPLHDPETQRAWLAGFVAAWGEHDMVEAEKRTGDPRDLPIREILALRLTDHPELLSQLQEIGERSLDEGASYRVKRT